MWPLVIMPTPTECVCCKEISATFEKTGTSESSTVNCITEREGFDTMCLNVWVLQASLLPTVTNMGHICMISM